MTAADRAARTTQADRLCAEAFESAGCPASGVALVAVGGYGREELAPFSDLDVVLVLDDGVEAGEWAGRLWYPLWDSGANVDHSVRTVAEVLEQCSADLRVALGMLDLRHLAGDPNLTLRLRTSVLAQWRRDARSRLAELHELVRQRHTRLGELGHLSVPDLKESEGGLRDATVLRGLVASWLVDVPHGDLERCRLALLDLRDALHEVAGRGTDRIAPEFWPDIAAHLGLPDGDAAQRHTRGLGRRLTHLTRLTWRRADAVLRRPLRPTQARRPQLAPIAPGIAVNHEEVVLAAGVRPDDPLLLLRAAAEAAERDLVLAPTTAARLVRSARPLPTPWPAEARDLFVRLLAAGPGLLAVWETLEETGAVEVLLPEWDRVRLLPHASVVHRWTVDRHLVETCIEASRLIRRVARPDVLLVAALLHDIGKGGDLDHSLAGAPVARDVAERLGFDERESELVERLVRKHLLLPEVATTRDLEDPATIETVAAAVHDREELDLLATLTEADARATSEKAWTGWRAGLVTDVVRRTAAVLAEAAVPPETTESRDLVLPTGGLSVEVWPDRDGSVVRVIAGDRLGLLADAAGMLALSKASVRSLRAWTQDGHGVSEWSVAQDRLDPAVLRQRLDAVVTGRVDLDSRLRSPRAEALDPIVVVRPEASASASVVEVRAEDRPGLLRQVFATLAELRISVRSAHVATLGPQAVDVFYLQEEGAGALSDDRVAAAANAVRRALEQG